ncbi:MAG: winged helix-turn-helix transcriptional regulator, partial [Kutzneria sp.]|nr:winged helix-turn-helix transcriptional regulator [Kutzneria sp.]
MPAPRRRRPATEAEAAALASDIRMRIIRLTYRRPLTNKELALRLDKDPATTLYHVRRLLGAGFLEELTPRRGTRGAREKPYRATGTQLALDFRAAASGSAVNEAAFGAFLAEVAAFGVSALEQRRVVLQLPAEQ